MGSRARAQDPYFDPYLGPKPDPLFEPKSLVFGQGWPILDPHFELKIGSK
jgi:hypothetical protein